MEECPLLAQSGHDLLRRTCLLLTQSGHRVPLRPRSQFLKFYGQFTCDNGARSVEWTRAQPPFFLPSGLDGGENPPPMHKGPRKGPLFYSAPRGCLELPHWTNVQHRAPPVRVSHVVRHVSVNDAAWISSKDILVFRLTTVMGHWKPSYLSR
jgi:hypothetical protein